MDGDPATPTETNPYHYVGNDPLNFVDPLGLKRTKDCNLSGGCTVVLDDQVLGRISQAAPGGGLGPPTGAEALAENHMFSGGPNANIASFKIDMLSAAGSAGVDIGVLFRTVRQEANGRTGGIWDDSVDWVKLAGAEACDRGLPGACRATGGGGVADISLGITNIQSQAYNFATSHRCGGGAGGGGWTNVIASEIYAIQMAAHYLAALDCDFMDYARSRPNQFDIEVGTWRWGFNNQSLYQHDGEGRRIISRNALSMFGYVAGRAAGMAVLNNDPLDSIQQQQWRNRQNAATNQSTMASSAQGMNLSDVNGFFCSYDGFFNC